MFDGAFAGSLECGLMDDDGCKMQTWLDKSENGPLHSKQWEDNKDDCSDGDFRV